MELLVVGTTPYFGRGLQVNPGARIDRSELMVRVYPGPAPALAMEALRWATRRTPRAIGHAAQRIELHVDGGEVPVQADGDVIGTAGTWRFEVRPRAVRLIGRW
jgi:diacylglycerol kinase family enzyme